MLFRSDDYAYMLEHSRAQAVLVSGALLPTLTAAMVKSDHEVNKVIVSKPAAPLHPAEVEFEAFLAAHEPMAKPAATRKASTGTAARKPAARKRSATARKGASRRGKGTSGTTTPSGAGA